MLRELVLEVMENHEGIVHFPIVLLTVSFIFAVMGIHYRRSLFKEIVFWNLIFGMISLSGALYSGFEKEKFIDDPFLLESLELHRRSALTLTIFIIFLTIWLGLRKKKMSGQEYLAWTAIYFIAASATIYQGYNGQELKSTISKSKKPPVPYERKELDYGWNF